MAPPRILEAPEIVPPPPALGGITIEAAEPKGVQRRPGIDVPLQAAPLSRRMAAATIDGLVILLATALFGLIFWKMTALQPPLSQLLELAVALPCFLWAAYQYLLLVYAGTKAALNALCRALAVELARYGVTANAILPGWIKSEMTAGIMANERFVANVMPRIPVRRFGEPEDFGGIAVYLMSKASSYHTADCFVIDGGYTAF